jgi:putative acetyltransferase
VSEPVVCVVSVHDPGVADLIQALTVELASSGYTEEETFGYSAERLESAGVHLVGVRVDGQLVGMGGVELQGDGVGELKRFYVAPGHRGRGVADLVMAALVDHGAEHGVGTLRLETGDQQHAAQGFYARHGFAVVDRFPPYLDSPSSVCMARTL